MNRVIRFDRDQLEAMSFLTPQDRLRQALASFRLYHELHRPYARPFARGFDTIEEYFEFDARFELGGLDSPENGENMAEIDLIIEELRREYAGEPWHGSSTQAILHGVTAAQAAARPLPTAHTIWELVLHLTAWTREVCRRVQGGKPQLPPEGDWPGVVSVGEAAWSAALAGLHAAHTELVSTLREFPKSSLQDVVGGAGDVDAGTGVSFYVMLHGLTQHDAYHSGQIGLLRKATTGAVT